jgi:hypothetical protein
MADKRKGIRIKNEETCRIIAELAAIQGVTKTEAVRLAVKERLERQRTSPGELPPTEKVDSVATKAESQQA